MTLNDFGVVQGFGINAIRRGRAAEALRMMVELASRGGEKKVISFLMDRRIDEYLLDIEKIYSEERDARANVEAI